MEIDKKIPPRITGTSFLKTVHEKCPGVSWFALGTSGGRALRFAENFGKCRGVHPNMTSSAVQLMCAYIMYISIYIYTKGTHIYISNIYSYIIYYIIYLYCMLNCYGMSLMWPRDYNRSLCGLARSSSMWWPSSHCDCGDAPWIAKLD